MTLYLTLAPPQSIVESLAGLLREDLDFQNDLTTYATHDLHAFPAKFPPQLPAKFIRGLTLANEVVLDPMMGSGTTLLESCFAGRYTIGVDIDPLAQRIVKAKTTPVEPKRLINIGNDIIKSARFALINKTFNFEQETSGFWDDKTRQFVDYWFAQETQRELWVLAREIKQIENSDIRNFFEIVFSSIIITKSGGVSLALDLAHTRPHRAKVVISSSGDILFQETNIKNPKRIDILTKTLRSPIKEFDRRFQRNVESLSLISDNYILPRIYQGTAQCLPLQDNSVDLIFTSPPYISNAIDYMRAHKFALVWFGASVSDLSDLRANYIGGDSIKGFQFQPLPPYTTHIVNEITELDAKKGLVVSRYYSEMSIVLREMYRVLRNGKAAVLVVGDSFIKERNTEIATCLTEIGEVIGFDLVGIGSRHIDRNRRMLPASIKSSSDSQIEQRMYYESVIGLFKP